MAFPIDLSALMKNKLCTEFKKYLNDFKLNDRITFNATLSHDRGKVQVVMSLKAYCKQMALVRSIDIEVAWHGVVYRDSNKFYIEDILVHPQIVSGAKVDTDEVPYSQWMIDLYEQDRDAFLHLNFQAHSHVNMSPSPSMTDLKDQEERVKNLEDGSFLICMIVNKSGEFWIRVYDKLTNTVYERDDIEFEIELENCLLSEFISDSQSMLTTAPIEKSSSYVSAYDETDYYENLMRSCELPV